MTHYNPALTDEQREFARTWIAHYDEVGTGSADDVEVLAEMLDRRDGAKLAVLTAELETERRQHDADATLWGCKLTDAESDVRALTAERDRLAAGRDDALKLLGMAKEYGNRCQAERDELKRRLAEVESAVVDWYQSSGKGLGNEAELRLEQLAIAALATEASPEAEGCAHWRTTYAGQGLMLCQDCGALRKP